MIRFPISAKISAEALRGNLAAIRRRLPADLPICAAVKADAYGHGLEPVLDVLMGAGVEQIAVAQLVEAIEARRLGWFRPILCLGAVLAGDFEAERLERADAVIESGLICTVTTHAEATALSQRAARVGRAARIEFKVDTGMGRFGVRVDEAADLIAGVRGLPGLLIEGVYSHLAAADEEDLSHAREQLANLNGLRETLRSRGIEIGVYHSANSAAIFRLPVSHLDRVRPGLAVYGYWGGPAAERPADLRPVMRVVGRLTAVRKLPAGHAVGYGRSFRTTRDSIIGVVPIGYADGYRRALSNDAIMTLEAARGRSRTSVPVVGRVSMDQTTVDLTDAGDVCVGDRIIIIDNDPAAANSVESLAEKLGTIPYEMTCLLGSRVTRTLV